MISMKGKWARCGLPLAALLGLIVFALAGCGGSNNTERAFLLQYRSEWGVQTALFPSSLPYATPRAVGSARTTGLASFDRSQARAMVYLDAGHGGVDVGTTGSTLDGAKVQEKDLTLAVALRTAALLNGQGITVALSRQNDSLAHLDARYYTPDGSLLTPEGVLVDLQHRIDDANQSGALVMLSIHFNSFSDGKVGGSETFFDSAREHGAENRRLAQLIQQAVVTGLRDQGYEIPDRGVTDDISLQAEDFGLLPRSYNHLVLLGPEIPGRLRASQMPAALSEPLFLSNPEEASLISRPEVQDALAHAYAKAIEEYLGS